MGNGWNLLVWLAGGGCGVVSRRWVWLVGGICGYVSGCCCKEVYRFPHITYPYSSTPTSSFILKMFFSFL